MSALIIWPTVSSPHSINLRGNLNDVDPLEHRNGEKFLADLQALTASFQTFTAAIPPFLGKEPCRAHHPPVDVELLFVHTLIHVTSIYIAEAHTPLETVPARKKQIILSAINASGFLIEALSDGDYEFLDPFISVRPTFYNDYVSR